MSKEELRDLIMDFLNNNDITIEGYDNYNYEDEYAGTDYYFRKDGVDLSMRELAEVI